MTRKGRSLLLRNHEVNQYFVEAIKNVVYHSTTIKLDTPEKSLCIINFFYFPCIVSNEQDEAPSAVAISTTEAQPSLQKKMPPPGYKPPPSVVKQATPSTNQPSSTKDGITSASPGVAMETESSGEGPKVVGSKESRTVFVSNLAMNVTEERLREEFSEVHVHDFVLYVKI